MSRTGICIEDPLLPRISPSGPSSTADLPSGGLTAHTRNA